MCNHFINQNHNPFTHKAIWQYLSQVLPITQSTRVFFPLLPNPLYSFSPTVTNTLQIDYPSWHFLLISSFFVCSQYVHSRLQDLKFARHFHIYFLKLEFRTIKYTLNRGLLKLFIRYNSRLIMSNTLGVEDRTSFYHPVCRRILIKADYKGSYFHI